MRAVSNVNIATDVYATLFDKVNQLLGALSTETITANATFANTTGNAQLYGMFGANTLIATGNVRGGNISSSGPLTISSNLITSGATVNVGSNLNIVGVTTAVGNAVFKSNSTITAITISGNSTSTNTVISGNLFAVTSNTAITGTLTAQNTATITGAATLSNTFALTGNATFSNAVVITGNVVLSNTLLVVGNVTFQNTFTLTGALTLGNVTITNSAVMQNTVSIVGALSLSNTLSVAGLSTVQSVVADGDKTRSLGNSTVSFANAYANIVVTTQISSPAGMLFQSDVFMDVVSNTNIGAGNPPIYRWAKASFSTGKFLVQVKNGTTTQISEILIGTDNGINAIATTYATISAPVTVPSGTDAVAPLGTFTANVNGANTELVFIQTTSSSAVKVFATLIK